MRRITSDQARMKPVQVLIRPGIFNPIKAFSGQIHMMYIYSDPCDEETCLGS